MSRLIVVLCVALAAGANGLSCEEKCKAAGTAGSTFVQKYVMAQAYANKAVADAMAASDGATDRALRQDATAKQLRGVADAAKAKQESSGLFGSRFFKDDPMASVSKAMLANGATEMAKDAHTDALDKAKDVDTKRQDASVAAKKSKGMGRLAITFCTNACEDMKAAMASAIATIKKKHPNNGVGVAFGLDQNDAGNPAGPSFKATSTSLENVPCDEKRARACMESECGAGGCTKTKTLGRNMYTPDKVDTQTVAKKGGERCNAISRMTLMKQGVSKTDQCKAKLQSLGLMEGQYGDGGCGPYFRVTC